jgi:hypothetical protein
MPLLAAACAGALFTSAPAAQIRVPQDQPTIQSAVNVAASGDEIILASGTYSGAGNTNVTVTGKRLTIRSETHDPADVTIDCQHAGGALNLHNALTDPGPSVIEGIRFQNASGAGAGAVSAANASLRVIRCVFAENEADAGSAIAAISSDATESTLGIFDCRFEANAADTGGGLGGAVYTGLRGARVMVRCVFLGNSATQGGAVFVNGNAFGTGPARFVNCVFSGNTASTTGGGVLLNIDTNTTMSNCTLSLNDATVGGGGVFIFDGAARLTNGVLWGNTVGGSGGAPAQIDAWNADPIVTDSCVEGTWTGAGFRNIDTDPLLADANGVDNVPGTSDDDCHLLAGSPCIDAGLSLDIEIDVEGNQRVVNDPSVTDTGLGFPAVIDLGAYEFGAGPPPCRPDVDENGNVGFSDILAVIGSWGVCP